MEVAGGSSGEIVVTGGEMVVTRGETLMTGEKRRWWLVVLLKRRLAVDHLDYYISQYNYYSNYN